MKKNILIIGGTSGIGYDISKKFILDRYNVTVVGRKIALPEIKNIRYFLYDLLKEDQLKRCLKKINEIKKIDIIIHCIGGSLGLEELNYKNCLKVWKTNIGIPIKINDYLISQKIIKKNSRIILFSSKAADDMSGKSAYNMSKQYLEAYVKNASKYYKNENIYFNCIKPSIVISTGNNWYKCKRDNYRKYINFIKKFNKNGTEINSNHIFKKIKVLTNKKDSSKLIIEI